jgi:hypothetical protein
MMSPSPPPAPLFWLQAAPALLPPSSGIPPALPLLIELGCSFGNTVTLPLLYILTMLPAADAGRAAGFMSLFHAAWSPCLWVFGYSRVQEVNRARKQQGPVRARTGGHGHLFLVHLLWDSTKLLWGRVASMYSVERYYAMA